MSSGQIEKVPEISPFFLFFFFCFSAKPPEDFLIRDMLRHGNFRGAEGAEKVPPIVMANVSMLQMEEMVPNLHEMGELRFERIEEELSAVEDKVDELLGKKYEVRE